MTIPIIHVHTASDKSTTGYARFMWETMRSLASHPEALKLSIHSIGPTAGARLENMPNTTSIKVETGPNNESGSMAHGVCVEHALSMMDDGDIHIIADSDTVVLAKGWDDLIRIQLLDNRVGMLGTAVEDIGGFSSGASHVQMAKNLPSMTWSAFSPLKSWRALKAMPCKDSNIMVNTEELSKIYNLLIGYQVFRDVGWQIPQYLHDHGISYLAWKQLKPSGTAEILRGLSDYHEEYHVDGVPFLVHQRGSLRHAYRSDRISTGFYDAVDRHLVIEAKKTDPRWSWVPNDGNADSRATLEKDKEEHAIRNPAPALVPAVQSTGVPELVHSIEVDAPTGSSEGWLKVSLDGTVTRPRQIMPVPKTVPVDFSPDGSIKHLRLEGTVTDVYLSLPPCATRPHMLTIRNLTNGFVKVLGAKYPLEVPSQACWHVLVDIDGVVRVQ